MPDTRYSYNVDLEHPTTSHSQAVLLVTPGSTVLDVGAADGSVARPLAARGCRVWAIELDAAAAAKARSSCERVIVGDVEQLDLDAALEGQRFDFVLLLDVLEHLRDPLALLERCTRSSRARRPRHRVDSQRHARRRPAQPDVRGIHVHETGLLDRTHLRFFDRRGAEPVRGRTDFGSSNGCASRGPHRDRDSDRPVAVRAIRSFRSSTKIRTRQRISSSWWACRPTARTRPLSRAPLFAERLQRRVEEIEANFRELETYARSLEMQTSQASLRDTELRDLRTELERRMEELALRHVELRHLQADLAVKEAFIAELRGVRTELERRMQELTLRHGELRHLNADLVVKEACIAELRQTTMSPSARTTGRLGLGSGAALRVKGFQRIPAGDRLIVEMPGGGGYGDPLARDPALVARDVRYGLIEPDQAVEQYGVVLHQDGTPDEPRTATLRAARAARYR